MAARTHYACPEAHKHRAGCPVKPGHTEGATASTARCEACRKTRRLWVEGRWRHADDLVEVRCPKCGAPRLLRVQVAKGYETRGTGCWACRGTRGAERTRHASGYMLLKVDPSDPLFGPMLRHRRNGRHVSTYLPEHRAVMARMIGRPLLRTEEVHHKNGLRTDNRPENLELWLRAQPPGQRVEDLIEWAAELLARYAPTRLAG